MRLARFIAVLATGFAVSNSVQADCTDVIRLSKTVQTATQSRESFESHAANFCSEYKKGTNTTKSANYGISYKLIAASMGTSKASEEEVASKVCSSSSGETSRADAYQQYVETISEHAFKAYESCERLKTAKLDISINSVLSKEVVFSVGNSSTKVSEAKVQVIPSEGAKCTWLSGGSDGDTFSLGNGKTVFLKCTRTDIGQAQAITIGDLSDGAGARLTVPWQAMDSKGVPIDLAAALTAKIESALADLRDSNQAMKGGVLPFDSSNCPDGWETYMPAFGRFIRGIDRSETKIDPDGVRAPGSIQGDSLGKHGHSLTLTGRGGNKAFIARPPGWGYDDAEQAPSTANTAETGGAETRPKNVALLYCRRK